MSVQDSDYAQQRADLIRSARAYLEWEAEISAFGIPRTHRSGAQASAVVPPQTIGVVPPPGTGVHALVQGPLAASEPSETSQELPPPRVSTLHSQGEPARAADGPSRPAGEQRARLALLDEQVRGCSRCELAKGRSQTVFSRGNPDATLVFVGEGPGQEEDRVGAPFVGAAGQLLDKMVIAMGFARDDVYICNVVKCRPPGNRTPLPVEAQACSPYLLGQLEAVAPRVIVALGRCAAENMGLTAGGGWRGRWGKFRGVDVMPTYHPAFLLRSPEFKRPVWEDLQQVMTRLKQPG